MHPLPQVPRGTHDLFEEESLAGLRAIQRGAMDLFRAAGYQEIETPMFESVDLFKRAVGEGSDIVNKEMYLFAENPAEPGKDILCLRPEGTAPVVRAYLQRHEHMKRPISRWCYSEPMFRRERPQAGRLRQFNQVGVECFGGKSAHYDAEVIALAVAVARLAGDFPIQVLINNLGDPGDESRAAYLEHLRTYIDGQSGFCPDCRVRREKNVLRVFDCKVPQCQDLLKQAPQLADHVSGEAREHHETVLGLLKDLNIPAKTSPGLVRGLDFYSRTVFEVVAPEATGAQAGTLVGGGRYDTLVNDLGGPAVPALGFAAGVERLLMAGQAAAAKKADISLLPLGEAARRKAHVLAASWRAEGFSVQVLFEEKSLKKALAWASKEGGPLAAILGENELSAGEVVLKNLETHTQEQTPFEQAAAWIRRQKDV